MVNVAGVFFDGHPDLPHFNPDLEDAGAPESVLRWRQALAASHDHGGFRVLGGCVPNPKWMTRPALRPVG